MITPDLKTFQEKSKQGNLIPVWREILADMDTPVSAFKKISQCENAFLLESVEQGESLGRYSFLGCNPEVVFQCKANQVHIFEHGQTVDRQTLGNPLDVLKDYMKRYRVVPDESLPPFAGGAVGYVGYDMVRQWENLPDDNPDDLDLPDAIFCLTDTLIAFDHVRNKMIVISNAHVDGDPQAAWEDAVEKIENLIERLRVPIDSGFGSGSAQSNGTSEMTSNFEREEFEQAVTACKQYITEGDIFQVVLSQRFQRPYQGDPFDLYRALRAINPSPYMYYLKLGELNIAGSSPEILIRLKDREVCVRPIAGTRPRGKTHEEDQALEKDLLADPKECAEHIMLLDLGRNDIGRVCKYGTVHVDEMMVIERYSHVMHIVSNVIGELKEGMDAFDVLRAGFPAGTVSGAPKIRAMEIIDEKENLRRGPYAGCVGYIDFNGNFDQAITIRTIVCKDQVAYVQAGAGIVADSVPANEFDETCNKARAMLAAVDMAEKGL